MRVDEKNMAIKTICVGRFAVDVPEKFEFSYGDARVSGVQISSDKSETMEEFNARIIERNIELAAQKNERDLASLENVRDLKMQHATGKIFSFGRNWSYHIAHGKRVDNEWFSIEALVRIQEVSFRLFLEIADKEDFDEVMKIIVNMRYRQSNDLPGKPGFCFDNGIILDTVPVPLPAHDQVPRESVVMFTGDSKHPDVAIALNSMSGVTKQKTLLQRSADSSARIDFPFAFQPIFEGRRSINGIPGEESSERVKENNGTRAHSYRWESDSIKTDAMKPFLVLELTTGIGRPGKPVNSSLSDKEVQALWDQISGSLRPRPVKVETAKPEPSMPPERAEAGTPCPASGQWSCVDHANGYDVVGGTTQKFVQGVKMPQAELLGPEPLFGRRKTFTLSTPTVWKLVKEPS
ncbi:hypothetical protein GCM10007386_33050 [Pseudoduganella dura]|nr:hypothetical protein GCM10007386_33050 [Pseudoduganella dura]